jgi:hypothetical protein
MSGRYVVMRKVADKCKKGVGVFMKRLVRGSLFAASLAAVIVVAASPAMGYNTPSYWNESKTPLEVTGYGSHAWGYGYIKIFNGSNGTRMYSTAYNKFYDADDHAAYLAGTTQYNAGSCRSDGTTVVYNGVEVSSSSSCTRQFYDKDDFRQNGLNYTNSSWVSIRGNNYGVHGGADRGRVAVQMGIDIPVRPDSRSGTSYSRADSW